MPLSHSPTAASNENGQFGLAETWLAFSCDRLSGRLVLRDGDVVVFHGSCWGHTVKAFVRSGTRAGVFCPACSHCSSVHPRWEERESRKRKKWKAEGEEHTKRSHKSKYRADLPRCSFTFPLFHKFHLEFEPSVNQQGRLDLEPLSGWQPYKLTWFYCSIASVHFQISYGAASWDIWMKYLISFRQYLIYKFRKLTVFFKASI